VFKKSRFLKPLLKTDHKYSRGIVGVLAGSEKYPGASILCIGGARRGGAGYVKFLENSKASAQLIYSRFPDVVHVNSFLKEKVDAIVAGPGGPKLVKFPKDVPLVLDSAAIASVDTKRNPITILTPHEGELKYLGYELSDRARTAEKIAQELNVIVVLKGSGTVVAAPGCDTYIDKIGGPELATAGSGDILAGLIGSMLASWKPKNIPNAHKVVCSAVTMHSLAGKKARMKKNPVVATDILDVLAEVEL
jgi:hydroxyethylthiazole kinase-like uncharacterized protein yjeF